jgi:hypothetical protein
VVCCDMISCPPSGVYGLNMVLIAYSKTWFGSPEIFCDNSTETIIWPTLEIMKLSFTNLCDPELTVVPPIAHLTGSRSMSNTATAVSWRNTSMLFVRAR